MRKPDADGRVGDACAEGAGAFDDTDDTAPAPRDAGAKRHGLRWRVMHAIVLETLCGGVFAASPQLQEAKANMHVRGLYPLITTPELSATRDFYTRHFGFQVAFEASWFVYLSGPADGDARGATLAFMHPDHPSRPPGPEPFDGRGMILAVEVADAAAAYRRLVDGGAPIVHPLTDEDWGQRRFMTRDPAGVLVDVVEQIEPKPGYWERYPVR